jgi:hypothetical protein
MEIGAILIKSSAKLSRSSEIQPRMRRMQCESEADLNQALAVQEKIPEIQCAISERVVIAAMIQDKVWQVMHMIRRVRYIPWLLPTTI